MSVVDFVKPVLFQITTVICGFVLSRPVYGTDLFFKATLGPAIVFIIATIVSYIILARFIHVLQQHDGVSVVQAKLVAAIHLVVLAVVSSMAFWATIGIFVPEMSI